MTSKSSDSEYALLGQKRFGPFFVAQFLGAFNDNVFKNSLLLLLAFHSAERFDLSSNVLINMSAGLFILPFFLFSATAGQLADKYEKSRLIQLIKILEIAIMCLAALALWADHVGVLIGLLFLMGVQSSLFGPVKYGILPQILDRDELLAGNGLVEMGTFLAILLGTALGGILIGVEGIGRTLVGIAVVAIASLGYISSLGIPRIAAVDPGMKIDWNPIRETWRIMGYARKSRTVFLCVLGISWFWFVGAIYLAQLPNFSKIYLAGDERVVTLLLALFSIGVGAGSLLCNRISGHRINLGVVPIGSIGLTVFGLDLATIPSVQGESLLLGIGGWLGTANSFRVIVDIVLLGMFGGFYIVPLYAAVQERSDPRHRSRIIAANNVLNALLMVCASLMAIAVLNAGYTIGQLFFLVSVLNGIVATFIFVQAPEFILRFCAWILVHTLYRVSVNGRENIPRDGGTLLVCNHVSYVDALVIGGCISRPVRFVMYYKIFDTPILSWLFRSAGAIPIASAKENPDLLNAALDQIDVLLARGEVVCVFPEGQITRTGKLNAFRPGAEKIIARRPVPVVPMVLDGLWGTFFSREGAGAMRHVPKPLVHRVVLNIGPAISPEKVSAEGLRKAVTGLSEAGR